MLRNSLILCFGLLLAACQTFPLKATDPAPKLQLDDSVVPLDYVLDLTVIPGQQELNGRVAITVQLAKASRQIYLHAKDMRVDSARFLSPNGAHFVASFRQVDRTGLALLQFDSPIPAGQGVIEISYGAALNEALEGLYKVREQQRDYLFSQFQVSSARLLFPGFDQPGFKTPFTISITTEKELQVIGNMPVARSTVLGAGLKRVTFEQSPPMPTYLLALALGPLDIIEWEAVAPTAIRDRPVPLRGISAAGKGGRMSYALTHTAALLKELEAYFGTPYPYPKLDLIAAPDFNAGAMENIGAIVYREYFLLLDEDAALSQKRHYAAVHAHELAHQWFGNLVTPRWWDDTWLNESFASWMAYKTVSGWDPDGGYEREVLHQSLSAMALDSLASARQIRQPIASHDDIANAFDGITYDKGAGVLAMFENYLGEEAFRDGVRLHMQRFAGSTADASDFMESLARGSDNPGVIPAFSSFVNQAGVPVVTTRLNCEQSPQLELAQQRFKPLGSTIQDDQLWQIPFCARLVYGEKTQRQCLLLSEAQQRLDLSGPDCPDAVMPNAGGAGYYRFDLTPSDWQNLLAHSDKLQAAELISLADSLAAAHSAGQLSLQGLLDAGQKLASHPAWDVTVALIAPLTELHDRVLSATAARALRSWMRQTYGPRLAAIGLDGDSPADSQDPIGSTLLRKQLVETLALTARDPALRLDLQQRAKRWIQNPDDPAFVRGVIPPDIAGTALSVAVAEEPEMGRRLLKALDRISDSVHRYQIINAAAHAPELAAEVRALSFSERIRDNEVRSILRAQAGDPAHRNELWTWLRENFDAVLARTPDWGHGGLVSYSKHFCEIERIEEIEAFFQPQLKRLTGAPRRMAAAIESIKLCAELRERRGDDMQNVLLSKPVLY